MAMVERLMPDHNKTALGRTRTGGPSGSRPTRFERDENVRMTVMLGTHMPLDTEPHWTWRNPLNFIPALLLVLLLVSLIGTAWALV